MSLFPAEKKETVAGNVSVFEFLGEIGYLTLSRNGLDLNVLAPADFDVGSGISINAYYDPDKIILFDPETEKNLFYDSSKTIQN